MRRKILAFSLLLIFISTQSGAVSAQQTATNNASLLALLDRPEAVFVVDVKRLLNQTAPEIFGGDAPALEKLRAAMKSVEDETGINPYAVEKIALGMNLGKGKPENGIFVLQTEASAETMIEKMYQAAVAKARLDEEINPHLNSLFRLQARLKTAAEISAESVKSVNEHYRATLAKIQSLDARLAASPNSPNVQKSRRSLASAKEKVEYFIKLTRENPSFETDLKTAEDLIKKASEIKVSDAQRAAKTAVLAREIEQFKTGADTRIATAVQIVALVNFEEGGAIDETPLEASEKLLLKLSAPRRAAALATIQKNTNAFAGQIETRWNEVTNPVEETTNEITTGSEGQLTTRPVVVKVSRRSENVGAKKLTTIVTENKYLKTGVSEFDDTREKSVGVNGEKILVVGDSPASNATVRKILGGEIDSARNQAMLNLINKSPNALASFAVDLRGVDFSELGDFVEPDAKIWQIYGSISGGASEISLTVTLEKTDVPRPLETGDASLKNTKSNLPLGAENSAAADLLKMLGKSISGVEGKFTIRFDRRKTAEFLNSAPQFFDFFKDKAR